MLQSMGSQRVGQHNNSNTEEAAALRGLMNLLQVAQPQQEGGRALILSSIALVLVHTAL